MTQVQVLCRVAPTLHRFIFFIFSCRLFHPFPLCVRAQSFSSDYMQTVLKVNLYDAARLIALSGVTAAVVGPLLGLFYDRVGRMPLFLFVSACVLVPFSIIYLFFAPLGVLHTNSHTALLISSIVLIAIGEVSLNTIAQTLLVRVLPSEYFSVLQVQWCSIVKHAQENAHTHTHTHTLARYSFVPFSFRQCGESYYYFVAGWGIFFANCQGYWAIPALSCSSPSDTKTSSVHLFLSGCRAGLRHRARQCMSGRHLGADRCADQVRPELHELVGAHSGAAPRRGSVSVVQSIVMQSIISHPTMARVNSYGSVSV